MTFAGRQLRLNGRWTIGPLIGGGGFGQVYELSGSDGPLVAKFVPKEVGAERELLFVELEGVRNVVPIIESGEFEEHWVLVMPRAECSLRQHLEGSGNVLSLAESVVVLEDIVDALIDLETKVVHRDLKPENILRLDGRWCLADFGIARYAEASTATDTQKHALSAYYSAPERWRVEHATPAVDIYAVGVMAFEMVAGYRPFEGGSLEELREGHLHAPVPQLSGVPPLFGALIDECLFKAPSARPSAANLRARLNRIAQPPVTGGLAQLEAAHQAEVRRQGAADQKASEVRSDTERRRALAEAADLLFQRISAALRDAIVGAAPSASLTGRGEEWALRLNTAELRLSRVAHSRNWGSDAQLSFEVLASARLDLRIPPDRFGYEGRSHSLWYCDRQEAGKFVWYELAFEVHPLMQTTSSQRPFALDPGPDAAAAIGAGMAKFQLAVHFKPLVVGALDDFINRWAVWFAEASEGRLTG